MIWSARPRTWWPRTRLANRAPVRREDELADLARAVAALTARLAETEQRLLESRDLQDRADCAADLLHNIRNTLAPLRVTLEQWTTEERLPYRDTLRRALGALDDPTLDRTQRVDLNRFVAAAARKLLDTGDRRVAELASTREAVDHVTLILTDFQAARADVGCERVDLDALLAREARQLSTRLAGAVAISLPATAPAVLANPVQLSQVVANLLVNAAEAIEAAGRIDRRIRITGERRDDMLTLCVTDNGEGIDPARLATLCERGSSTRAWKSGGIGLHWCANAMRAMGGSLVLDSAGPGLGATAMLTLRCADALPETSAVAA